MLYGRLANEDEDPFQLDLPFPVEFIYFPFALISDASIARGLWMTCLEIVLVALVFLSLRLTGWKPSRILLPILLTFSILGVYGFLSLSDCRAGIFVALAISGLLLAIREERDELAGALLVVPVFMPDIAGILVLYIFWWAIYHRRWRILAGFLMTIITLLLISFFILSDWFIPFISGWLSHIKYNPVLTPGGVLGSWWKPIGQRLGWVLTIFLLVVLIIEWRNTRRKGFRPFLWTAGLSLAVTPLMGIPMSVRDYVPQFFPLILFLSVLAERWPRPGLWSPAGMVTFAVFLGPWLLIISLSHAGANAVVTGILALVFPVLLVTGLYWMRWWAVRPLRLWSDNTP